MLWPVLLPLKITFWLFAAVVTLVTIAAPVMKWKRTNTCLVSVAIAVLAFVPSCTAIMAVIDAQRFGVFEIATFDAVDDFRVERCLPPASREIIIDKYAMGFRARFSISQRDLDKWFDDYWRRYGEYSVSDRDESATVTRVERKYLQTVFDGLGWELPARTTVYEGPATGNGAGFTLWYNPDTETAFQRGGYW